MALTGQIKIYANLLADVGVRYPGAFTVTAPETYKRVFPASWAVAGSIARPSEDTRLARSKSDAKNFRLNEVRSSWIEPIEGRNRVLVAQYSLAFLAQWTNPGESQLHIGWARASADSIRPFSSGAYYLNYLGEEGEDTIKAAFGPNYERLKAVKKKYDPENFFCLNQNIKPRV